MPAHGLTTKEMLLDEAEQVLGENALATIEPRAVEVRKPGNRPKAVFKAPPVCSTQKVIPRALQGGPASIFVGFNYECPRWQPGSVVRWAFAVAAEAWNAASVGVTFEWVQFAKDATFVLCHGGDKGGVLAEAFFPNANDLNFFFVYTLAFKEFKESMSNIFEHELGHVLGLRHEFAMGPDMKMYEGGDKQLGPRNEFSVMNYRLELPKIQPSDIDFTKKFYQLKKDKNGRSPRVGMTPVKDYTPM
ncbi:1f73271d-784a-4f39-b425-d6c92721710b [Sclerotinia trifoliorum]|uniref:1f73271d-784a-4f39-b425-d6c92721710b n=1 Tax=Sclerotinia trifoliorum TaxID=28548 RepID=A0A8H2W2S9_9HELO|nr:1f73271d-784a-4f39-b425-d6c92721710b [Sclerotinia trifoliorum]